MTAMRTLLGTTGAILFGTAALAQSPPAPPPLYSSGTGVLETTPGLTSPQATPSMVNTLTAPVGLPTPPGLNAQAGTLHQRILASPENCCGPVGAHGPVTYELYTRTGPTLIVGGGNELSGATQFGWSVQGGGRTLLFDADRSAAWALDLGLRYAYNGADQNRVFDVFTRRPQVTDPTTGVQRPGGPDGLIPYRLRGLTRTDLTFGIGRDWFLNGPGTTGECASWNSRFGVDVGGRWGNVRADLIPVPLPDGYTRKNVVSHAVTLGAHWDAEIPFGGVILFTGVRTEWGHVSSNVVPPQDGSFQDVGILLTLGVRF